MLTFSADLNQFGNPVIWGENSEQNSSAPKQLNPYYNRILIEKNATNINILITPVSETVADAANTIASNSSLISSLSSELGLSVTFDTGGFKIYGNILSNQANHYSDVVDVEQSLSNIVFYDSSNNYIENQVLRVTINDTTFAIAPKKCSNEILLGYTAGINDYPNPLDDYGKDNRGEVEYQYQLPSGEWLSIGTSLIGEGLWLGPDSWSSTWITAFLSYNPCDKFLNTPFRAIRTIREVPNCGGTPPII